MTVEEGNTWSVGVMQTYSHKARVEPIPLRDKQTKSVKIFEDSQCPRILCSRSKALIREKAAKKLRQLNSGDGVGLQSRSFEL